MTKLLMIIFAGKESHEGMGRVANALIMAKELIESGHKIALIFDGAGTEWLAELSKQDNSMHGLYQSVKSNIVAACDYCAGAFGVKDALVDQGACLVGEYMGHPSFEKYVAEGYQMITF